MADYLTFGIGGERYALEVARVREVIPLGEVAPLPFAPRCVAGFADIRGEPVPLVDLPGILGYGGRERAAAGCVLVLELGGAEPLVVGAIADSALGVVDLALEAGAGGGRGVRGIGRFEGRFVTALDAEALLGAEERAAVADLVGRGAGRARGG